MKRIYLDYAATTPVHPEVVKAMEPYYRDHFGNPSAIHHLGQESRIAMEKSTERGHYLLTQRRGEREGGETCEVESPLTFLDIRRSTFFNHELRELHEEQIIHRKGAEDAEETSNCHSRESGNPERQSATDSHR